jgi:hypothetical protein
MVGINSYHVEFGGGAEGGGGGGTGGFLVNAHQYILEKATSAGGSKVALHIKEISSRSAKEKSKRVKERNIPGRLL